MEENKKDELPSDGKQQVSPECECDKSCQSEAAATDVAVEMPASGEEGAPSDLSVNQNSQSGACVKSGVSRFFGGIWGWLKAVVPGLALCAIIAVPAWFLGKLLPVVGSAVFAIVIGMIIAFFRRPKWLERGIKFTSKKILQTSIVFLGFGMNFITVVHVGGDSIS